MYRSMAYRWGNGKMFFFPCSLIFLKVRPDLNGSFGTVVEWDDKEQRWKVSRNATGE